jgi:hypothetical protein
MRSRYVVAMTIAAGVFFGAAAAVSAHGQGQSMGPRYYQGCMPAFVGCPGAMPGYRMMPRQYGMGPGMMGYGMGPGMMGYGMGPGMMGYGMGPGMGYGMGPGMGYGMGPGMMGYGMGPGMMGYGMGPGAMGQGMGPGAMGQGMGPGAMGQGMGPGAMGQGMGPGAMGQGMMGQGAEQSDLSADQVRQMMQDRLAWQGNPHLKLGDVTEKDDDTIVADVVTQDGSLVERYEIDRHTGWMSPVQ